MPRNYKVVEDDGQEMVIEFDDDGSIIDIMPANLFKLLEFDVEGKKPNAKGGRIKKKKMMGGGKIHRKEYAKGGGVRKAARYS